VEQSPSKHSRPKQKSHEAELLTKMLRKRGRPPATLSERELALRRRSDEAFRQFIDAIWKSAKLTYERLEHDGFSASEISLLKNARSTGRRVTHPQMHRVLSVLAPFIRSRPPESWFRLPAKIAKVYRGHRRGTGAWIDTPRGRAPFGSVSTADLLRLFNATKLTRHEGCGCVRCRFPLEIRDDMWRFVDSAMIEKAGAVDESRLA
jgi:hypothetical protein